MIAEQRNCAVMSNLFATKFLALAVVMSPMGCATAPPPVTIDSASKTDLAFTAQSHYPTKQVEWIAVDNVDQVCRGFAPLTQGRRYVGCAVHNATQCRVYTNRNTSLSILGHEIRHCFEGAWHR